MEIKNLPEEQEELEEQNYQSSERGLFVKFLIGFLKFIMPTGYDLVTLIFFPVYKDAFGKDIISCMITIYILTKIGVAIAKFLLKFSKPSYIMSNGFWDGVKKKFYWNFGPQLTTVIAMNLVFFFAFAQAPDQTNNPNPNNSKQPVEISKTVKSPSK